MLSVCFVVFAAPLMMTPSSASEAGATSILQMALRNRRTLAQNLRAKPDQAASILDGIDVNHDGQADLSEVAAFATRQGLDVESTKRDFSGMDINHDGLLNLQEISTALSSINESPASSADMKPVQTEPILKEQPVDVPYLKLSQHELADTSVSSIAEQLSLEQLLLSEASELDRQAQELLAQKKALQEDITSRAMAAAMKTANAESSKFLTSITNLEEQAKSAETQAAMLRAKLRAELKQADELMKIAGVALHPTQL